MYDRRRFPGSVAGPVTNARRVDLSGGDFEDPRGFVWTAIAAGEYTFRPAGAEADLTLTLEAGGFPAVGGVAIMCSAVRSGASLSILAANL